MQESWENITRHLLESRSRHGLNFSKEALRLKEMGADQGLIENTLKKVLSDYRFHQLFQPLFVRNAKIYFEYQSNPSLGAQATLGRKCQLGRESIRQIIAKQSLFWPRWQKQKPRIKRELYNRVLEKIMDQPQK